MTASPSTVVIAALSSRRYQASPLRPELIQPITARLTIPIQSAM